MEFVYIALALGVINTVGLIVLLVKTFFTKKIKSNQETIKDVTQELFLQTQAHGMELPPINRQRRSLKFAKEVPEKVNLLGPGIKEDGGSYIEIDLDPLAREANENAIIEARTRQVPTKGTMP